MWCRFDKMLLDSSKTHHGRINYQFFLDLHLSDFPEYSETLWLSGGSLSDGKLRDLSNFSKAITDSKNGFYTKISVVTNLISNLPNRLSWVYFHFLCAILTANPLVKKLTMQDYTAGLKTNQNQFYNFCIFPKYYLKMGVMQRRQSGRHKKSLYIFSFENGCHATRAVG